MALLMLAGPSPAESYVEAQRGTDTVRRGFRWKSSPGVLYNPDCYPVFNQTTDSLNGAVVRSMNDDSPPYFVNGSHLGGNHAFLGGRMTMAAHGKTNADIGSVWAKGGVQFVLIRTLGTNQLLLAQMGADVIPTTGTFTHVSGATNKGNIVATAASRQDFYPMIANYSMRVFADGQEIGADLMSLNYVDKVAFAESYDVLSRDDVLAWFIANGATGGVALSGPPLFSVSNTYVYDMEANLTVYSDFFARQNLSVCAIYGVQIQSSGASGYCVPKTRPFTHGGAVKNYSLIYPAGVAPASTVNFDISNTDPTGLYLDRFMSLTPSSVLACGFLPVQGASVGQRDANVVGVGLHIATSNKVYMRARTAGAMFSGESLSFVSYRNVAVRGEGRTCCHTVRTNEADYVFVDWHDVARMERVPMPPDLLGRPFSVFEKSSNVSVVSEAITGTLLVNVNAVGDAAYLMLKVA